MGRRRRGGRNLNGILLLDKSQGVTSNGALQMAKKMFAAAKAGHTGSLDPLATGMLPICFGEATKFSQFLLDADKRYRVTAQLGVSTETGDADGEVRETRPVDVTEPRVLEALDRFLGEIEQVPSMYSAIKHNGTPLYKLAREGITVERKPRRVTIHEISDARLEEGDRLSFDVACSKGTYVRSLVEDLGEMLGCGAHVAALRRLSAGPYPAERMLTLEQLGEIKAAGGFEAIDELLLPLSTSVADWPRVALGETSAYYLRQGQPVMTSDRPMDGWVSIYEASTDTFMGVGEVLEDGRIAPRRLVS
ncbi:tRNA pseudouridine(55) synthase TruB [Alcanivorax sp. ST75FaO-1]|uniref:tRNA pseudouridine(55) synthase TruB n=1 Tax=Alloalcanivorax profundimaris TaxID=2735259 RepID=UPI000C50699A|nr:tRNA pseudouridine(55) synthase TruB [Alloalcanivorax profundimaris]MAO60383.1 tRNA pseudouridine(55) synthase TruB [Alcanivorax sp.]MCQ6263370.1 tRNA pseudouridine(55) synthase TruB [Alcanivorax sp. MM125-6]UWN49365.1 tRNA pseudouridine synthase B [Alcanivorax sp. ALC70]MAY12134.1 tRNA pseudouridine(55) synthase TruB [Alcanivorax sp.]MBF1802022.1 tRNA pseudouridine(55) synthase TruB [Alloalcanivorax profundimaris]